MQDLCRHGLLLCTLDRGFPAFCSHIITLWRAMRYFAGHAAGAWCDAVHSD